MSDSPSKAALLELIQAEHANLLGLLEQLDDARLNQPGAQGHWSAKDVLAHLMFWEQLVADELQVVAAGQTPAAIPGDEIQPLNEKNVQANRGRSRAELRAGLDRSMQSMLAGVGALSAETLAGPCTWTDEGSLAQHVANEMGHWQDHMAAIRQWLAQQPGKGER